MLDLGIVFAMANILHNLRDVRHCFEDFCKQTILHGWHYLAADSSSTDARASHPAAEAEPNRSVVLHSGQHQQRDQEHAAATVETSLLSYPGLSAPGGAAAAANSCCGCCCRCSCHEVNSSGSTSCNGKSHNSAATTTVDLAGYGRSNKFRR